MKVVLLRDMHGLGRKGDAVSVKEGYARNFLLPKQAALPLTESNRNQLISQEKAAQARELKARKRERASLAKLTASPPLTLKADANENGTLYKAVHEAEILAAIREQVPGFDGTGAHATSARPIKHRGDYTVTVTLPGGVSGNILIHIT